MYATGAVLLPFFSLHDLPDRRPDRRQVLQLDRHDVAGQDHLRVADAVRARLPRDVPVRRPHRRPAGAARRSTSTSPTRYFVVAHFHYVLFGTIVFATYAGHLLLVPEDHGPDDGRDARQDPLLADVHRLPHRRSWCSTGWVPRACRAATSTTCRRDGFTTLNTVSTIGAFILGASTLPFLWNVFSSYRYGEIVTVDDPWGYGNSLEWATSLPAAAAQLHRAARGSAPSARRSSCTTRTWSSGTAGRRTPAARHAGVRDRRAGVGRDEMPNDNPRSR